MLWGDPETGVEGCTVVPAKEGAPVIEVDDAWLIGNLSDPTGHTHRAVCEQVTEPGQERGLGSRILGAGGGQARASINQGTTDDGDSKAPEL